MNFQEIANPFYIKSKYDGLIRSISFFNNMIVIVKDKINFNSNLLINNSYENKRYLTKIKRNNKKKIQYFIKYMIIFKSYTLFLYIFNFFKKILLFRF